LQGPQQMGIHHRGTWVMRVSDQSFQPAAINTDQWSVTVSGPETHHPQLVSSDPGRYIFELAPGKAGDYTIEIFKTGKRAFQERLEVVENIVEAQAIENPYLAKSTNVELFFEGKGITGGKINEPISFDMASKFNNGQPANISPGDIEVVIKGPSQVNTNILGGGALYTAEYKISKPGKYTIEVMLSGKVVKTTQVNITGRASTKSRINASSRVSPGPFSLDIVGIDPSGLSLSSGNESFAIAVAGPENGFTQPSITDNQNGTFTVKTNLKESGATYEFHVTLGDQHISNSPFTVTT